MGWWCSVLPCFTRATPNHLAVNGTAHTVMDFHTQLGKHIGIKDPRFGNVPDGGGLYYVPNNELLNGLILGHTMVADGAENGLQVALFGTIMVPSFRGHLGSKNLRAVLQILFLIFSQSSDTRHDTLS